MPDYRSIYRRVFSDGGYNNYADDIERYRKCYEVIGHSKPSTIIDIGSGRGVLLRGIYKRFGHIRLTSVDLDNYHGCNCQFINADITSPAERQQITGYYDLLTCTDVLEHIDEKHIADVIEFLSTLSNQAWYSIAEHEDIKGGEKIHLIIQGREYWQALLQQYYSAVSYTPSALRVHYFLCGNNK